jgi:hypothetical protein
MQASASFSQKAPAIFPKPGAPKHYADGEKSSAPANDITSSYEPAACCDLDQKTADGSSIDGCLEPLGRA